jgi:D-alanyl-lipoteichoic acid acyltransferase DltB (MBOAT superfamily)
MSFLPQILSGPIVRYDEIKPSLEQIDKPLENSRFIKGISLFVLGLAKKVIIADTIASLISPMLSGYSSLTTLTAWIAVIGYTFQLYFDFSGYTDMAIAIGLFFGLKLPLNFNSPYKALNISDFWRRWHMSLTRWVNDYLFLPLTLLGKGITKTKILFASIITMIILGIWHGAGWTFIFFGLYHGIMLASYQLIKKSYDKLPIIIRRGITFIIVIVGFVIFRSESMSMFFEILKKLFSLSGMMPFFNVRLIILVITIIIAFLLSFFFKNTNDIIDSSIKPNILFAVILAILFAICVVAMGRAEMAFLYYQF